MDSVTLLANGNVLTVLGAPVPSTIFSPASNSFTLTGALSRVRGCGFSTTLLGDGRVLLTGGEALVPAEMYNPGTGLFSDVGYQQISNSHSVGITLANGNALLIGGILAEIYDPLNQVFTISGGMRVGRFEHTATVLQDGRVLVFGGCSNLPCASELYTPP